MKIGIVTQPLFNNYGGLLQNYALQHVLKKLGHEPKTIDLGFHVTFMRYLLSTCKQILRSVIKFQCPKIKSYVAISSIRKPVMSKFVDEDIEITRTVTKYTNDIILEEHFDAIITGSDQVWRPIYNRDIEDMYLKFVPDEIKKIAYAASFGVDNWEYNEEQTQRCATLANRLDAISVRENCGVSLCKNYLGVNATCVLDPTILAGAEAYKPLLQKNKAKDYLFAYILDVTQEKKEYIEILAKRKGFKAIIRGADKNATLSVEEWLSMIANASMVITDSFHGTVFSILFHRDFYSIVNIARGGTRFASLLIPLGLEHRSGDVSQLQFAQASSIDWMQVDQILDEQRNQSMNFLTNSLR